MVSCSVSVVEARISNVGVSASVGEVSSIISIGYLVGSITQSHQISQLVELEPPLVIQHLSLVRMGYLKIPTLVQKEVKGEFDDVGQKNNPLVLT